MRAPADAPPAVAVEGLTKTFATSRGRVTAVDDVSFAVEPGSITGLLGPNGAGKTTTIKSVLGLVRPTAGTVRVGGVDPHASPRRAYREVSAMLEGARNVYWRLSARENLAFFAGLQGADPSTAERDALLGTLGLDAKADEPVRDLSRGQQQKVALACTLVRGTPVVFLDEPTLGLDVDASRTLREELARLTDGGERTVILSSHDMDVVQAICDRVLIMKAGRVIADDTVAGVTGVLDAPTYRITLSGRLPDTVAERYAVSEVATAGEDVSFEVTLPDDRSLYDLMDRLRREGAVVTDLTSVTPDLEEAFLRVTGDEAAVAGGSP